MLPALVEADAETRARRVVRDAIASPPWFDMHGVGRRGRTNLAIPAERRVAAPRITAALVGMLALGIFLEATFAGAFLGGHPRWMSSHENLGNFLVLPPLGSLVVGLALRRRQPEPASMLASRVALLILVIAVVSTGHEHGSYLVVHIPAAVATVGLVTRQAIVSTEARKRGG